eukprot:1324217-Ditylum_brightwellii.AAC.1
MVIINSNAVMALVQYQGATTAAVRKIMKNDVADKLEEKNRQHLQATHQHPIFCATGTLISIQCASTTLHNSSGCSNSIA